MESGDCTGRTSRASLARSAFCTSQLIASSPLSTITFARCRSRPSSIRRRRIWSSCSRRSLLLVSDCVGRDEQVLADEQSPLRDYDRGFLQLHTCCHQVSLITKLFCYGFTLPLLHLFSCRIFLISRRSRDSSPIRSSIVSDLLPRLKLFNISSLMHSSSMPLAILSTNWPQLLFSSI